MLLMAVVFMMALAMKQTMLMLLSHASSFLIVLDVHGPHFLVLLGTLLLDMLDRFLCKVLAVNALKHILLPGPLITNTDKNSGYNVAGDGAAEDCSGECFWSGMIVPRPRASA